MPEVSTLLPRTALVSAGADGLGRLAKRASRRSSSKMVNHVDSPGRDVVGLLSDDGAAPGSI